MNVLTWIVIGLIAGWLAGKVMKGGGFGLLGDIILGLAGALVGGFLAGWLLNLPDPLSGFNFETLVVAFAGSVLVLYILRLLRRA